MRSYRCKSSGFSESGNNTLKQRRSIRPGKGFPELLDIQLRKVVNNLRKYFYMHKTGNVHYTINLVDEYGEKYKKETSPAELVAEQFLERNSEIT